VKGNVVLFDQCDEVRWRVTCQRGLGEVGVGRKKILWPAIQVGKVASAASGDQNLFSNLLGTLKHGDAAAALARSDCTHESGCTGPEHDYVKGVLG
jgi:hypothetical protein